MQWQDHLQVVRRPLFRNDGVRKTFCADLTRSRAIPRSRQLAGACCASRVRQSASKLAAALGKKNRVRSVLRTLRSPLCGLPRAPESPQCTAALTRRAFRSKQRFDSCSSRSARRRQPRPSSTGARRACPMPHRPPCRQLFRHSGASPSDTVRRPSP